ncbi:MAGE family-domain-containing protein [Dunaliella salina]|uniref:MAGE family-domain-containing protein n=1 Tax=Dunaliella salina TaxID=3046 RepID=A0ABQ7GV07_DUNSA|nr:MAGE family-domain-containing protein [Dunaliella salina]|eukprot:KAF5838455.1 MAGE family-domain-containing protein [Dunaliella salina]
MRASRVPKPNKRYSDCVPDPEVAWGDENMIEAHTQSTQRKVTVKGEQGDSQKGAKRRNSAPQGSQRTPLQPLSQPRGVASTPVRDADVQEDSQAGPGPSSQQQRQRQKQQQQAQPKSADVQWLEARIAKYKQEEAIRKEEAALPLDNQELTLMAGVVVRYMLFSHHERPGVPVPRGKLNDVMMMEYADHPKKRKIPPVVMAIAQARMLSVFGIDMVEVERPSEGKKGDDTGNKYYVLRSALPAQMRQAYVPTPLDKKMPDQGLIVVVLSLIHMQGGKMKEDDLWATLELLGVQKEVTHPHFEKPKDAMQKLEAARYIIRRKAAAHPGGQVCFEYAWGECAHSEVSQEHIKTFIEDLFNRQQQRRALVCE